MSLYLILEQQPACVEDLDSHFLSFRIMQAFLYCLISQLKTSGSLMSRTPSGYFPLVVLRLLCLSLQSTTSCWIHLYADLLECLFSRYLVRPFNDHIQFFIHFVPFATPKLPLVLALIHITAILFLLIQIYALNLYQYSLGFVFIACTCFIFISHYTFSSLYLCIFIFI